MKRSKATLYLIPALLCLAGIIAIGYYHFFTAFSKHVDKQYVYIDDDDTTDSIYAKLEPIATAHALTGFRTLARHFSLNENIHSGRYAIDANTSTIDVYRIIRNGRQEPLMLTIPEARTMPQLAARLSAKLMLDSASIANAITSNEYCKQLGYDTATIASLFVPNTRVHIHQSLAVKD